jgi:hypothetical protein
MGAVAAELAQLLGRGALTSDPTMGKVVYMPWDQLSFGGVRSLVEAYAPLRQWVLVDCAWPMAMGTILPINIDLPLVVAWPGATARDLAVAIAYQSGGNHLRPSFTHPSASSHGAAFIP